MWFRGYIKPFWTDNFKSFDYIKRPPRQEDLELWQNQGYNHQSFTGESYNNQENMPNWVHDIAKLIGLENCGYTFYKMKTGDIMPTHVDHFEKYCEIFNIPKCEVWRAVVVLSDWCSGHYFEIDNTPIVNYKKGEYILWSHDTPHAAANIGIADRYTLQITGTKI